MPANISARAVLWIGIGLIAVCVVLQVTRDFVLRLADVNSQQAFVNSWWFGSFQVTLTVLVPLGTLMVAAFFVARLIDRGSWNPDQPEFRITAVWVFWAGVLLTIVGLLVEASLYSWFEDLNSEGRTSLALDALNIIVNPLRALIVPLGLALLPASVLMKKLEVRHKARAAALQATD